MTRMLAAIATVLVFTAPALAQTSSVSPDTSDRTETGAGVAGRITKAASDSVTQVAPVLSIEGSTAAKIASAQIALQLTDFTLTVGAQAKLSDSATGATLADLDGLKNKTTGKFGLMWQYWDIDLAAYRQAFVRACEDNSSSQDTECTYLHFKNDTSAAGKRRFKELRRKLNPGTVYFAGANGEISPEEFAYVNESDLSDGKVRHTSWSAAVFGGVLLADGVLVSVNYKRQVAYKANDTVEVCSPIKSPGSLSCSDQTIGPPGDPKRSHQTGIEVRKIFNEYFALSPKLTRDWTHDLTGAELPIYFFRSSDGGLNGGVSLGYTFEKKAFTATAFVGQVLGLITR